MNETNEQTVTEAQVAEANEVKGAQKETVSLGKFKNAEALLAAYNSLQAEFTKRCQRIKELEAVNSFDKTKVPKDEEATAEIAEKGITEEEKNEILKGYLKDVLSVKSRAIIMEGGGAGVTTPTERPKSLDEAANLAKKIFD